MLTQLLFLVKRVGAFVSLPSRPARKDFGSFHPLGKTTFFYRPAHANPATRTVGRCWARNRWLAAKRSAQSSQHCSGSRHTLTAALERTSRLHRRPSRILLPRRAGGCCMRCRHVPGASQRFAVTLLGASWGWSAVVDSCAEVSASMLSACALLDALSSSNLLRDAVLHACSTTRSSAAARKCGAVGRSRRTWRPCETPRWAASCTRQCWGTAGLRHQLSA